MNTMMSVLASLSVLLFGSAAAAPVTIQNTAVSQPQSEANAETIAYEIVKGPYPAEVTKALQGIRQNGGQTVVKDGDKVYLVIGLGQRSTGGHSIKLDKLEKAADGTLLVNVHEQKPQPGAMTTQVISYPTMVIALPELTNVPTYKVTINK